MIMRSFPWARKSSGRNAVLRLEQGGGDYTQKKVLSGEAQPHGLTPYPFIPPFLTERYPFVYLSLTNGTPLTYLPSLELCIPFNCCKYTVFEI